MVVSTLRSAGRALLGAVVDPPVPMRAMAAPHRPAVSAAQIERLFRLVPTNAASRTTNRGFMVHRWRMGSSFLVQSVQRRSHVRQICCCLKLRVVLLRPEGCQWVGD